MQNRPAVVALVMADLHERKEVGMQTYRVPLLAGDDTSAQGALKDAYEEALDLAIYLRAEIARRDGE